MNIVLFVGDTVRADHLGCYDYFRDTTPHIDQLAAEGAVADEFFSGGCPTGPGFTSIYTGLYPINHGYYQFGSPNVRQIDDKIFTLPEVLRAAGYKTVAFDNLMNCLHARAKHFARGYDIYINSGPEPFNNAHFLRAEQLNRQLLPWIEHSLEEPFFLFVHYWDPHMPYNQPDEYRSIFAHNEESLDDLTVKTAKAGYEYVPGWGKVGAMADKVLPALYGPYPMMSIDLYDGELRYMDNAIGEVVGGLKKAGVYDDTAILFTADHGEHLYQHEGYGWEHHGLHDADTHLPLVIRYPEKMRPGTRVSGFCQQIDLLSTIVELAGLPTSALEVDGASALPLVDGDTIRDQIFMEDMWGQRAVRTAQWKLLDNRITKNQRGSGKYKETELFDVLSDPMEVIDLAEENPAVVEQLRGALDRWIAGHLSDGRKDPAIYDDLEQISDETNTYREKIARLMESFGKR